VYVLWRFISSGILHCVGRRVVCCISKGCNAINLRGTTHPTTLHTQQHYTPNNTTHPTTLHTQQQYTHNSTTHPTTHWIFSHMALRVSNLALYVLIPPCTHRHITFHHILHSSSFNHSTIYKLTALWKAWLTFCTLKKPCNLVCDCQCLETLCCVLS